MRVDLSAEAIRLGQLLISLLPGEAEVHAVLALMLLHDARRPARLDARGDLVPLDEHDRSLWDRDRVDGGIRELRTAQTLAASDAPYLLQAEIAACHSTAERADRTDWPMVVRLYDRLLTLGPTPHAELARAVAVGMADGPRAGLREIRGLRGVGGAVGVGMEGPFAAAEADLLRRAGQPDAAAAAYRRAIAEASTDAERRYLRRRLAESTP